LLEFILTAIISTPIIYFFFFVFLSFSYLHVWKETNYILFDSVDGKCKLVLDLKTFWVSVMRKSPIKFSQGNKFSEWPSVAWTLYWEKSKCACWFKICLWDTDSIFVRYEAKVK
jgi:hypothetical protein